MRDNYLFLMSYKRLENELVSLSNSVYFSDAHLDVYSQKIIELLLRCGSEIEAISKELYCRENISNSKSREDLKFDFDCCKWFVEKWKLDLKVIRIQIDKFDFSTQHRSLYPLRGVDLSKKEPSYAGWKRSYMAAKHNRIAEFKECTLFRLIEAMAALYLLNLVFAGGVVLVEDGISYPNELDSVVFEPTIYYDEYSLKKQSKDTCIFEILNTVQQIDNGNDYVYITKSSVLRLSGFETLEMKHNREQTEANRLRYRFED